MSNSLHGDRPKIKLQTISLDTILEIAGFAGLAALGWFSLKFYPVLPERIPTHFGLDGSPDGWGSKNKLLIFAAVGTLIFGSMQWLIRRPHIFNFPVKITSENAERQYSMAV